MKAYPQPFCSMIDPLLLLKLLLQFGMHETIYSLTFIETKTDLKVIKLILFFLNNPLF